MIVRQSKHIMLEPKLKPPITSDMADIVEAYRRNGLIRKKPGAITMNGVLYVHPKLMDYLERRITQLGSITIF
jgi:hypothetical protein